MVMPMWCADVGESSERGWMAKGEVSVLRLASAKANSNSFGGSAALIVTAHCRVLATRDWSLLAQAEVRGGRIKCRHNTSAVASRSCLHAQGRAVSALVRITAAKGQKLAGAAPSIDMRLSISHTPSYPQPDVISDRLFVRMPSVHVQFE